MNDYRDWGVPLGRRFRALKLWFVIRGFGVAGIQSKIREHISLNNFFTNLVNESSDFEIVTKSILNLTCFRFIPSDKSAEDDINTTNEILLDSLNKRGRIYLSHTKVHGKYALRMVIGQTFVEKRHIQQAWDEINYVSKNL